MTKLVIAASLWQSQVADLLPCNNYKKSQLTYSLLRTYGLFECFDHVIEFPKCSKSELLDFHSREYVDAIMHPDFNSVLAYDNDEVTWNHLNQVAFDWKDTHTDDKLIQKFETNICQSRDELFELFKELSNSTLEPKSNFRKRSASDFLLEEHNMDNDKITDLISAETRQLFNLEGDCPIFSYLPMYLQVITGATLSLSKFLVPNSKDRTICINWDGGRHHASKKKASGFCYVNDVVLLIQRMRKDGFKKITYLDFDLHHGDGVEKAFQFSKSIQTISLHLFETGFFPGTGGLSKKGSRDLIDIPLSHGLTDDYLFELMKRIVIPAIDLHAADAIVIQCGGDGLSGDKFNEWQLTVRGLTQCIINIIEKFSDCQIVLLGGGGYNELLVSRFYTYLTWKVVQKYSTLFEENKSFISNDDTELIAEHEYIEMYAKEHYKFWIYEIEGSSKHRILKDYNEPESIELFRRHYGLYN